MNSTLGTSSTRYINSTRGTYCRCNKLCACTFELCTLYFLACQVRVTIPISTLIFVAVFAWCLLNTNLLPCLLTLRGYSRPHSVSDCFYFWFNLLLVCCLLAPPRPMCSVFVNEGQKLVERSAGFHGEITRGTGTCIHHCGQDPAEVQHWCSQHKDQHTSPHAQRMWTGNAQGRWEQ